MSSPYLLKSFYNLALQKTKGIQLKSSSMSRMEFKHTIKINLNKIKFVLSLTVNQHQTIVRRHEDRSPLHLPVGLGTFPLLLAQPIIAIIV